MGDYTKVPLTNFSDDPGPPYLDADWCNRVDDGVDRAHTEIDTHEGRLDTIEGANDLADLDDVVITSPVTGEAITFNGSEWVNGTVSGGGGGGMTQATETALGGGELATQAETNAGTDDLRIITALKLKNATSLDIRYYTETEMNTFLAAKADLSGGKVPTSQIPLYAISEPLTAASQAAMLALSAGPGDIAIRTDFTPNRSYMLTGSDPTVLANWIRITFGDVASVFGRTGAVVAASGDYNAGQITNAPAGSIAAVTVQAALDELDTEKQAISGKNVANGYVGLGASPGTPNGSKFLADDNTWKVPAGGGGGADWASQSGAGSVFAAWGDGDPRTISMMRFSNLTQSGPRPVDLPSGASSGRSRCVRFRLPKQLTLASVRFHYGAGPIPGSGAPWRFGIYNAATGVALWVMTAGYLPTTGWNTLTTNVTPNPSGTVLPANTDLVMAISSDAVGTGSNFTTLAVPQFLDLLSSSSGAKDKSIGFSQFGEFLAPNGLLPASFTPPIDDMNSTNWPSTRGTLPIFMLVGTAA